MRMIRRKLEFHTARDDAEEDNSCWTSTWKFIATLLLTCVLLGPILYSSYNRYRSQSPSPSSGETEWHMFTEADQLECATELNISYSKLFNSFKESEEIGFCVDQMLTPCVCPNPTVPVVRNIPERKYMEEHWRNAFERNLDIASSAGEGIDVVLLGDSITEAWLGTVMAQPTKRNSSMPELFVELFQDKALALGIAGDRTRNLLYRLQNGEIPDSLNPAAWWILIGTNDSVEDCTREAILVGQMAVVDEVVKRKPQSRVVIQGLMPRGRNNLLESTVWQDFQWINERLECLAQLPQLHYFNGTSIFLTDDEQYVNKTLMYDFLHPSIEGNRLWGMAIIERLRILGIWDAS